MPLPAIQQRIAGVVNIVVSFDKTFYQADDSSALLVKRGIKEVVEVAGIKDRFDSYCTYELNQVWAEGSRLRATSTSTIGRNCEGVVGGICAPGQLPKEMP
jgi:hypothetical protein